MKKPKQTAGRDAETAREQKFMRELGRQVAQRVRPARERDGRDAEGRARSAQREARSAEPRVSTRTALHAPRSTLGVLSLAATGLAVIAATLLLCTSASSNSVYPVSGKVTYNGAPAAGAVVFLHRRGDDSANQPPIRGTVQQDGSFELVSGAVGRGVPPGSYDMLIEWQHLARPGKRPYSGPDRLKGRYADRQHPLLHVTVEARATSLSLIELADIGARSVSDIGARSVSEGRR